MFMEADRVVVFLGAIGTNAEAVVASNMIRQKKVLVLVMVNGRVEQ